jgi:hypothetical protein
MVRFVFKVATAAWASLGTTSPRYSRQVAMYLPLRGSHFTIWLLGSKHDMEISMTELASCEALAAETTGA